jgi:alpha/beta superfamily hydrolase
VRFNFRGVGDSQGAWDEGRGEIDDALAVARRCARPALPLVLGGLFVRRYVASRAAAPCCRPTPWQRLVLVAPAVLNFRRRRCRRTRLVIHGEADEVVPLSAVLDWARPQDAAGDRGPRHRPFLSRPARRCSSNSSRGAWL